MYGIFFKVGKFQLGKSKRWLTICRGMGSGKAGVVWQIVRDAGRQAGNGAKKMSRSGQIQIEALIFLVPSLSITHTRAHTIT